MMKNKMAKLGELSKSDRNFRLTNIGIMIFTFLSCVGMAIYYGIINDPNDRLMPSIGMALVMILPIFGELIFRKRLSNVLFLSYQTYAYLAGFIGSVLNVYNIVWWYDILIHALAGYVFALVGIFVVARLENYKNLKPMTVMIFCLCITLASELIWELAEWAMANLFQQPVQGEFVEGFNAPLVTDTMQDILCNLIGGLVFCVHFVVGKFSKHSLGIKTLEQQLAFSTLDKKVENIESNTIETKEKEEKIIENKQDKSNKK